MLLLLLFATSINEGDVFSENVLVLFKQGLLLLFIFLDLSPALCTAFDWYAQFAKPAERTEYIYAILLLILKEKIKQKQKVDQYTIPSDFGTPSTNNN